MAGRPFDIVDATGLEVATQNGISTPRSLGAMRVEDIVASGVRSRQREFTRAESDAAFSAWSSLRHENAPLRIIRDGRLVSAPLTQFDALLVSQATSQWTVAARIIGLAMQQLSLNVDGPGQNPGDLFPFGRLLALNDKGDLDVRGIGRGMRDYEVRDPPENCPRF
jgi:hypothetical protein